MQQGRQEQTVVGKIEEDLKGGEENGRRERATQRQWKTKTRCQRAGGKRRKTLHLHRPKLNINSSKKS